MKKLFTFSGLLVGAALALAAVAANVSTPVSAAPACEAVSKGPRGSAFTIKGLDATVSFKVTGPKDCKVQVSAFSFYAPSMTGRPYDQQTLFQKVTKTVGPGDHTMTVKLPAKSDNKKGCFYQVDLDYGTKIKSPVLAYGHGKLDCSSKPPEKKKVEVCEIKTGKRVMVNEGYDKRRYTKDFSKCDNTPPVTPPETPETPETPATQETAAEMPQTGPVETFAQMMGIGSLIASAGYYIQSRRING